jgi:AcrR family transcriptional regulator
MKRSRAREKRTSGRPANDAARVGKDAIVERTRALLREVPPPKVSLREIARSLKIDPGLIRYYFEDKNGLFTAVVQEVLAEHRERHRALIASDLSPADKIRQRILIYLDILFEHPYLHQLIVELVLYSRKTSAAKFRKEMVEQAYSEVEHIVRESGALAVRDPMDARFLHVAIIGMCEYFIVGRPLVEELFSGEPHSRELVEKYGRFLGDILVTGLGLEPAR